jgi:two-component system chemotaxis response regulator CheB
MRRTRVLIADDSPLFRELLCELLEADGDIRVVGEAGDGEQAVSGVRTLAPDMVTIDLRMPGMGGLLAIEQIMAQHPLPILVITGDPTATGGDGVFEASARGALELVEKARLTEGNGNYIRDLVRRLATVRVVRHVGFTPIQRVPHGSALRAGQISSRDLIAVAASSGGPSAVAALLGALPSTFPACIAVVQHLPVGFAAAFARYLADQLQLEVAVVTGPTLAEPGRVLVAPDEQHLVFADGTFMPSSEPSVGGHRPSATALFRSLVPSATRTIGVVLTGMGEDGVAGLRELRNAGGLTFAQSQQSAAVFGMPKAAIEQGAAEQALGLEEIAKTLLRAGTSKEGP